MNDPLGDRMKMYEQAEAGRRLMPLLPALARLDGRCFSAFTRNMKRPYDTRLSDLMAETTHYLVEGTGALAGYTQSDEITLLWYSDDPKSQIFFDGRIHKLVSNLASLCTVYFAGRYVLIFDQLPVALPSFDCRAWNVPTKEEAANVFLWREWDAAKNSISMAARHYYSHNELDGKNGADMQEMLFQKGVNWNNYPSYFKRGTYVIRRKTSEPFTAEELDKLPPLHNARRNPELVVERSEVRHVALPPLGQIANRVAVLFQGADPYIMEDGVVSKWEGDAS